IPPIIDVLHGGSGVALPETLAKAYATITGVDTIITGHGAVMHWDDLKDYADFNRDFLAWTRDQFKAGRTADAAAGAFRLSPKYTGYHVQYWQVKANVDAIYEELRRPVEPPPR